MSRVFDSEGKLTGCRTNRIADVGYSLPYAPFSPPLNTFALQTVNSSDSWVNYFSIFTSRSLTTNHSLVFAYYYYTVQNLCLNLLPHLHQVPHWTWKEENRTRTVAPEFFPLVSIIHTNANLSFTIWFKPAQNKKVFPRSKLIALDRKPFFFEKKKIRRLNKRTSEKPYHLYHIHSNLDCQITSAPSRSVCSRSVCCVFSPTRSTATLTLTLDIVWLRSESSAS